jgi:ribonucleotide monophosphatase NagD (HAD superfamily)
MLELNDLTVKKNILVIGDDCEKDLAVAYFFAGKANVYFLTGNFVKDTDYVNIRIKQ